MNAGNSAMFHLQPLTASTDRKGPLQHISSCVSLDLTVFALSSWVSCQPRGSGFDIKLIASVTQCVSYCEMLTPATCLILRRSCILQTTGSQEISEKWFCSVCVLGSLKVKRTQYIKNAHFTVCVCVIHTQSLPSVMHCVIFIILAADSRELDFLHPPTHTHKRTVEEHTHTNSLTASIFIHSHLQSLRCSLARSCTHVHSIRVHTYS